MVNGALSGVFRAVGPKGITIMIKRRWHVLPSVLYAASHKPDYPPELTPEEVAELERFRLTLMKTIIPALGMAKTIASRFPPEVIEQKITAEWILKKLEERHPGIAKAIKDHGEEGMRWLEEEALILRNFLLGRI